MDITLHNTQDASFSLTVLDNGVHALHMVIESAQFDDRKSYDGITLFFDTKAQYEVFKKSIQTEME